ncbi:MAG TPA: glycosyltransferase family 9 protein [Pyrinomonadaceae bacterium]|nr:glycosyltransferase family 9 protein [Pyrinomonadaceae bacterium]
MKPQNPQINWQTVNRVLVIRLKSIGDTVLTTPALIALRRFLPEAQIDILLEDWVAPVLEGFDAIDNVISFKKDDLKSRLQTAWKIRQTKYDVVFNLHGGTTSGFFVRASGAKYRVGYSHYRYTFFHNQLLSSSADFWNKKTTHSAEQQLALLGFAGIPIEDKPKSSLNVTEKAKNLVEEKLKSEIRNPKSEIALLHPVAAFDTKQWSTENFARIAEYLNEKGFQIAAVATKKERETLEKLQKLSKVPIAVFDDLTLPEITALASKAEIFVGNDSGIAHISAAVKTPSVIIFGSSNRDHWRPWTDAPNEIVYEKFDCQPCAGYFCKQFSEPKCILSVKTESVIEAIEKVLA